MPDIYHFCFVCLSQRIIFSSPSRSLRLVLAAKLLSFVIQYIEVTPLFLSASVNYFVDLRTHFSSSEVTAKDLHHYSVSIFVFHLPSCLFDAIPCRHDYASWRPVAHSIPCPGQSWRGTGRNQNPAHLNPPLPYHVI